MGSFSVQAQLERGGATVIVVRGEIDHIAVREIQREVTQALARQRPHRLSIDLGLVTFMSSEGLGTLVACRKLAERNGSRLMLRNPSPFLQRLLQVSGAGLPVE